MFRRRKFKHSYLLAASLFRLEKTIDQFAYVVIIMWKQPDVKQLRLKHIALIEFNPGGARL